MFFDAFSGVAGDMTVAALLDLGVPRGVVDQSLSALPLEGYRIEAEAAAIGAIGATRFNVHVEAGQPQRSYALIERMLNDAPLDAHTKALSRRVFRLLAEAEARVHRVPVDAVHFHEVGAVDSIVDIVAAAAGIAHLGALVVSAPLPMGRGFAMTQHGRIPLPAPAVLECVRGVPTYDAGIEGELVTPTGAALVVALADRYVQWPELEVESVGWGAGTCSWPDRPNGLRLVLGRPTGADHGAGERMIVVEANVDDMTGELAAHTMAALLSAGAVDAWAAPVTGKKGRPSLLLSALATRENADRVQRAMLTESTTLGVRFHEVERLCRPRRSVDVETRFGRVPMKVADGGFGPAQIKPEFDACARLAREAGVPVRVVSEAAIRAFERTDCEEDARPRPD